VTHRPILASRSPIGSGPDLHAPGGRSADAFDGLGDNRLQQFLTAAHAGGLDIAIHADHNHHGPDTAFDVNHEWYELMIDQAATRLSSRSPNYCRHASRRALPAVRLVDGVTNGPAARRGRRRMIET
jgi:hypothetical protein